MLRSHVDCLSIRFDLMTDMGWVIYSFYSLTRLVRSTCLQFSFGGGSNMISEGDSEGLTHTIDAAMK